MTTSADPSPWWYDLLAASDQALVNLRFVFTHPTDVLVNYLVCRSFIFPVPVSRQSLEGGQVDLVGGLMGVGGRVRVSRVC